MLAYVSCLAGGVEADTQLRNSILTHLDKGDRFIKNNDLLNAQKEYLGIDSDGIGVLELKDQCRVLWSKADIMVARAKQMTNASQKQAFYRSAGDGWRKLINWFKELEASKREELLQRDPHVVKKAVCFLGQAIEGSESNPTAVANSIFAEYQALPPDYFGADALALWRKHLCLFPGDSRSVIFISKANLESLFRSCPNCVELWSTYAAVLEARAAISKDPIELRDVSIIRGALSDAKIA